MAAEIVAPTLGLISVVYKVIQSIYRIVDREKDRSENCVRLKRKVEFIDSLLQSHRDLFTDEALKVSRRSTKTRGKANATGTNQQYKNTGISDRRTSSRKEKDTSTKKALRVVLSALKGTVLRCVVYYTKNHVP